MSDSVAARNALQPRASSASRASSAERVRRHREWRRRGQITVALDIRQSEVRALVACRLLARDDQGDREAISTALGRLLDRALFAPGGENPPSRGWDGMG